jgi:hypothetical protein
VYKLLIFNTDVGELENNDLHVVSRVWHVPEGQGQVVEVRASSDVPKLL